MLYDDSCCNTEKYKVCSDNELIEEIRKGEEQAEKIFYSRYTYIVRKIASSFFILGADKDDLFQEAMIGLFKAVKSYNREVNDNFKYFAELCIRRQIITAIRQSNSYKKNLLNNSVSIYEYTDSENNENLLDRLVSMDDLNPEIVMISKEEAEDYHVLTSKILSGFERNVLIEYSKGKTYEEISYTLKKDVKSIDNALQRIKKKIYKNKDAIKGIIDNSQ